MSSNQVKFYTTPAIEENKQTQFCVAGLPKDTAKAGKGTKFEITLVGKDGQAAGSLVLGDTHCVWKSHQQTEEQKALWDRIKAKVSEGPVSAMAEVKQVSGGAADGIASFDISELLG